MHVRNRGQILEGGLGLLELHDKLVLQGSGGSLTRRVRCLLVPHRDCDRALVLGARSCELSLVLRFRE
jgi:hypothetical protein